MMAKVKVRIPAPLQKITQNKQEVEAEAGNIKMRVKTFFIIIQTVVGIFLISFAIGGYGFCEDKPPSQEKILITISGGSDNEENIDISYIYFTTVPDNYKLSLPEKGPYTIELLSAKNTVLASYSFGTDIMSIHYIDGSYSEKDSGMFMVDVPFEERTKKVIIRKDSKILWELTRSLHAPEVYFKSPAKGEELSGEVKLEWSGSDTDGDAMSYRLEYSSDGGYLWDPLLGPDTLKEYVVNTEDLILANKAIFRVAAMDGLNVGWARIEVVVRNSLKVVQTSPFPGEKDVFYQMPEIQVNFRVNKIKESTVTAESLVLLENGEIPFPAKSRILCLKDLIIFQFDGRLFLKPGTKYTARLIAGIEDMEGNILKDNYEWSFSTEGKRFANPQVDRVSPGRGNRNVPINALIQATFEGDDVDNFPVIFKEDIDSNTINAASFILKNEGGNTVDGTVSYNHETKSALFTPAAKLSPNTTYKATLTTAIVDSHGLHLESDYIWSFTTGSKQHDGVTIIKIDSDQGIDTNKDGLYDKLVLKVQIEILAPGKYNINAKLMSSANLISDSRNLVAYAIKTNQDFSRPGIYLVDLEFKGSDIARSGIDGSYQVYGLSIFDAGNGPQAPPSPELTYTFPNGHRTYPYKAKDFSF